MEWGGEEEEVGRHSSAFPCPSCTPPALHRHASGLLSSSTVRLDKGVFLSLSFFLSFFLYFLSSLFSFFTREFTSNSIIDNDDVLLGKLRFSK